MASIPQDKGSSVANDTASNDNGRALEYLVTHELHSATGWRLTDRAEACQARDISKPEQLEVNLRGSLEQAAVLIAGWIVEQVEIGTFDVVDIDRPGDSAEGVADLLVADPNDLESGLLLSLKHNSAAIRHPRPYSLVKAIGLAHTPYDESHRKRLATVADVFRRAAGGAAIFADAPAHVKRALYVGVCIECKTTLDQLSVRPGFASALFRFLVAPGFWKMIVTTSPRMGALQNIVVEDWTTVIAPTSVNTSVEETAGSAYLRLRFDNGWSIGLRIHNASSGISSKNQLSLKFDAQRDEGNVPKFTLFTTAYAAGGAGRAG